MKSRLQIILSTLFVACTDFNQQEVEQISIEDFIIEQVVGGDYELSLPGYMKSFSDLNEDVSIFK